VGIAQAIFQYDARSSRHRNRFALRCYEHVARLKIPIREEEEEEVAKARKSLGRRSGNRPPPDGGGEGGEGKD